MKENQYLLGLVSVSFRGNTPKEIIQAVKNVGLSCIEWGSDVHAPCRDIARLNEIAELQKEYDLFCSSYGTYFRLGKTPLSELTDYITAAKILGTNVLRLWCGTKSGKNMTEEERRLLLEECRKSVVIAEKYDVFFCMECHHDTIAEYLDDALDFMKEINSPRFRMYWQPFQWQNIEENMKYAEAIAPYTRNIHVFQWKGQEKFSLNEGIEEWQGYLSKFTTPRTLLLEFMPDGRIETLPTEMDALKRIIKG